MAFWLFAQTTLNIAPAMAADLNIPTSVMNIAVSITALRSGIFIAVIGGPGAERPMKSPARHQHTPEEERRIREAALDKTIADSFPASDPPSSNPNPDDDSAIQRQRDADPKRRDR